MVHVELRVKAKRPPVNPVAWITPEGKRRFKMVSDDENKITAEKIVIEKVTDAVSLEVRNVGSTPIHWVTVDHKIKNHKPESRTLPPGHHFFINLGNVTTTLHS